MLRKILKLFSSLFLVGLTIYLLLLNMQIVPVSMTPSLEFKLPIGVLVIGSVVLGILLATVVALYFGFLASLREKSLRTALKRSHQSINSLNTLLDEAALGNVNSATSNLFDLLKTKYLGINGSNLRPVHVAVALSDILVNNGQFDLAIKVLEEAGGGELASVANYPSLAIRLSRIMNRLGHKASSFDILDSIIRRNNHTVTVELISEAVDLGIGCKNFTRALEIIDLLPANDPTRINLHAKVLLAEINTSESDESEVGLEKLEELEKLHRMFPNHVAIAFNLAELRCKRGQIEDAGALMLRGAKLENSCAAWQKVVLFWLKQNEPQRAISATRAAEQYITSVDKITKSFLLESRLAIFVGYGMANEAIAELNKCREKNEEISPLLETVAMLIAEDKSLLREKLTKYIASWRA